MDNVLLNEYKNKLITAKQAASMVKSGDWIDYGWCLGHTFDIDKAIAARAEELTDVNIRSGVSLSMPEIFKIENPDEHFTWNSWHYTGIDRQISEELGCGFYSPIRYSEVPRYYRENVDPIAISMCQVAPIDKHGFFNFGPQASHQMATFESSQIKIVEVNQNMPRCLGGFEESIPISKIDYIVEGSNPPLPQLLCQIPTEIDQKVAEIIMAEIPDGACLQLGIGGMPNAVGMMIAESDLKDLGVHTEMYVDAFVDITNAGKITGARKSIDRFRQSFAFAAGTDKLYEFVDDNPSVASYSVNYTNDPYIIGRLDNFMSINNAVEVDLFGQVCAETSGFRHISGTGGQLDFVMGAYLSKGGKSFICMSSTYEKDGVLQSRITPTLKKGSIVTDSRTTTHYVVTEFGMANMKGKSTWQRAEALVAIAHPEFKEQLVKEAEKMHIWRRTNRIS